MNGAPRLAVLALLFPAAAIAATATVTPGGWTLYRGAQIVQPRVDHATLEACVEQAKALNVERTYTCRTRVGVAVAVDAPPPPPPPPPPPAGSVTAASPNGADVVAAVNAVQAGGTVLVPAGTGSWQGITLNKAATIRCADPAQTVITVSGVNLVKPVSGALRIENCGLRKSGGGNNSYGITFSGPWPQSGVIVLKGNAITISNSGFILAATPGGSIVAGNVINAAWDDSCIKLKQSGVHDSWRRSHSMGTADATGTWNHYIEGNRITGGTNQCIDADDGTRVVYRHNVAHYSSFNSHGMDTSDIGVRHWEVYRNEFRNSSLPGAAQSPLGNQNWAIWIRGAGGVIFENTIDDMANPEWGFGKPECKFDIRSQQDGAGSQWGSKPPPIAKYSAGRGDYPRERQLGQDWDETLSNTQGINGGRGDYVTAGIWIWGNTGSGARADGSCKDFANGGAWGSHGDYFQLGRDYFIAPKPGYVPYPYPHPLR